LIFRVRFFCRNAFDPVRHGTMVKIDKHDAKSHLASRSSEPVLRADRNERIRIVQHEWRIAF
ncbi:MAG: hypothetical protein ACM3WS_02005, partial [Bacillota bacterium]